LKNLDIDLRRIRLEVEKIVQSGPDVVTMGKLPQTPMAKKVIEYAREECNSLNHHYVGTEHLLLGLIREQERAACQVLVNLGIRLQDVRKDVLNTLGHDIATEENSKQQIDPLPHPRTCDVNRTIAEVNKPEDLITNNVPLTPEHERIRSLEQQLWNV